MKLLEAATAGVVEAVGGGIAGAVGGGKSGLRFPGQESARRMPLLLEPREGTSMHPTHSKATDEEGEKIGGLF